MWKGKSTCIFLLAACHINEHISRSALIEVSSHVSQVSEGSLNLGQPIILCEYDSSCYSSNEATSTCSY